MAPLRNLVPNLRAWPADAAGQVGGHQGMAAELASLMRLVAEGMVAVARWQDENMQVRESASLACVFSKARR